MYDLALDLSSKSRLIHGFDIIVGEGVKHGISVIINKVDANIEYILVDSLNSNFKIAYNESYWQAIKTLKNLLTHRKYFRQALLRRLYARVNYLIEEAISNNNSEIKKAFRAGIDQLSQFNLKDCELYKKIYKKQFIDLITKYKLQYKDDVEVYDKFLAEL